MFPNYLRVKDINRPVAILHARDDKIIKIFNAIELYQSLNNKHFQPLWLNRGGHNNINREVIEQYLIQFKEYLQENENVNLNQIAKI